MKDTVSQSDLRVPDYRDNYKTDIPPNPPPFDDYAAVYDDFSAYLHEEAAEVEPPPSLTSAQNESETEAPLFIWANDLKYLPPLEFFDLPRNHYHPLPCDAISLMYGESGAGKSFLALSYGLHIAQSLPVLYIAGEGMRGYHGRVQAWIEHYGGHSHNLAFWNTTAHNVPQFTDPNHIESIIAAARAVGEQRGTKTALIVIDTVARSMAGADENSNREMSTLIEGCDSIKRATEGAAVLLVHHTGKAKNGSRGGSALPAGVDCVIALERDSKTKQMTAKCEKAKDWAAGDPIGYKLVDIGFSCAIVPIADAGQTIESKSLDLMAILADAGQPIGKTAWIGIAEDTKIASNRSLYAYTNELVESGMVEAVGNPNRPQFLLSERGYLAVKRPFPAWAKAAIAGVKIADLTESMGNSDRVTEQKKGGALSKKGVA